ncbi:hypothetical protein [Pseudoruegeria sp. HB172150]|uniref:hypothetical protein n=1 Tax=Pseudoruegeria sp. HB172150 TaxID=2721164 RepID=UPI001553D855|nr:hypothetical protein [Pseudoruegeria sp. HB172150]
MNLLVKSAALAGMVLSLTSTASSAYTNYSCLYKVGNGQANGTIKYQSTGLFDDYVDRGGSASTSKKTFFIVNHQNKEVGNVRLKLYDKDNKLIAQKTETSMEAYNEYNDVNTGAKFTIPWVSTYQLYVQVRWRKDDHYKSMDKNDMYEFGSNSNGLVVTRSKTLGTKEVYCW